MFDPDAQKLKLEFEKIDLKDTQSLREWFSEWPELTIQELCFILGKSEPAVINFKHRLGVNLVPTVELEDGLATTKPEPQERTEKPNRDITKRKFFVPLIVNLYATMSLRALAKTFGCSKEKIKRTLVKNGIIIRTFSEAAASKNKYCNSEWLIEHYYTKRLPLKDCAEKAHVSTTTIRRWLTKFGYSTRHQSEATINDAVMGQDISQEVEAQRSS